MNPAGLFSAGVLLTRVAGACGTEPALVTGSGTVSHRQLAALALEIASEHAEADAFAIGPGRGAESLLAAYAAYLSPFPARAGVVPGQVEHAAAAALKAGDAGSIAGTADMRPDARAFDDVAQVSSDPSCGELAWSHEALSYGWGVSTPLPGTVGILGSSVWSPMAWASAFGVLLARGRVVVPAASGTAAWLDAIVSERVTEVHLSEADLDALLELPARTATSVANVRVWARGAVGLDALAGLRAFFPAASIGRVLAAPGGPLSLALLPLLEERGPRALGRTALGVRLSVSPESELQVAESAFAPRLRSTGLALRGTGIAARKDAAGGIWLTNEPVSRGRPPRNEQAAPRADGNGTTQGGARHD